MKIDKIIYSSIVLVTLAIILIVIGFNYGDVVFQRHDNNVDSANKISNSTAIVKIEKSETARLRIDGSIIKILASTYLNTTNFIFLDEVGRTISTLSISNINIEAPFYNVVKGQTHDWLVVTRVEGAGNGRLSGAAGSYTFGESGNMKMVLSYLSRGHNAQYEKTEYLKTNIINESYPDDSAVDIKFTLKDCFTTQSGEDKNCSESSRIAHYVWDDDSQEFVFDSKKSDISEQGIDGLL